MDTSKEKPRRDPRPTVRRVARIVATAVMAVLGIVSAVLVIGAQPAAANTPSDVSRTFYVGAEPGYQGLPVTVGWTQDHAWVIASWAAAMTAGAGEVASELCGMLSGDEFPVYDPIADSCSNLVSGIVAQLVNGQASLTNHGLWVAFYAWGGRTTTSGTW